jgi:NADPH-dependent 2,4-dienoyl-CoA reductase/sulfur reductase-like enzyme
MTRIVVIGGSDAGISAALRAREMDSSTAVTVIVADTFPNYSICGLPFYLSGEVPDWQNLAHRTHEEITAAGISVLLDHTVQAMNTTQHRVTMRNTDGQLRDLGSCANECAGVGQAKSVTRSVILLFSMVTSEVNGRSI